MPPCVLWVGVHPLHMPPCVPWWVYYPGIHHPSVTVIPGLLKERGKVSRETLLSPLRINLLPARKQAYMHQQTRYRKHLCTRNARMLQPLFYCRQTPLKVPGDLFSAQRPLLLLPALYGGWAYSQSFCQIVREPDLS